MQSTEQQVQQYYDRNTGKFLRFARSAAPKAIHQPLYIRPGMSLGDALHTHHDLILDVLKQTPAVAHILDLGCGVAESLIYLAGQAREQRLYGVTLSGKQVVTAQKRIHSQGLTNRIQVEQGSFLSLPAGLPQMQLVFAIESFIHATRPDQFFSEAARILDPGGLLIVFDDFLKRKPRSDDEQEIVENMLQGWLANTLMTPEDAGQIAQRYGLRTEHVTDYSHALRLNRVQDKLMHLLVPFARPLLNNSQYCRFMVGGDARQMGYKQDIFQYCMLVLRKV